MKTIVYVIEMSRNHGGAWGVVYSYRSIEKACETFNRLTTGITIEGYAFRLVERVTRERVLDSWEC